MIRAYYLLVINGRRTCDPDKATDQKVLVPDIWRTEVVDMLTKQGYDLDGVKSVE